MSKTQSIETSAGHVRVVTIDTERLTAISNLSKAIVSLAEALTVSQKVEVHNCNLWSEGPMPALHVEVQEGKMEEGHVVVRVPRDVGAVTEIMRKKPATRKTAKKKRTAKKKK